MFISFSTSAALPWIKGTQAFKSLLLTKNLLEFWALIQWRASTFFPVDLSVSAPFQIKHSHDAFLVLGSDGLSFAISDQEIVDIGNQSLNPAEACNRLTDQAQHFGSEDNVTVMVIPLGAWGKYQALPSSSSFSFGRILSHSKNYWMCRSVAV